MNELMTKLSSRKFWISAAAFLASLGTGISGIATGNDMIATVGAVCLVLSGAIYTATEAYVDAARIQSSTTNTTISAVSTSKELVEKALNTPIEQE